MSVEWSVGRNGRFLVLAVTAGLLWTASASAQLILNEAKTLDEDKFLQVSYNEIQILNPYEGYDYGVVPYSGNTNSPDGANPGNPFPIDLDTSLAGNQTTLLNGWNGTTGWGRVIGNGGDWFELVVTEDHTDLRGYTLYWENNDLNTGVGVTPDDRGFVKFTRDKLWADLRAGTILTLSEDDNVDEIRDKYPTDVPTDDGGPAPHDTLYDYDLSTDTSFNPFTANDWHVHVQVDEDITKGDAEESIPPAATQYFEALSDVKGHNRDWEMKIFNASNTALAGQVETSVPRASLDLTTGTVQNFVGEKAASWAANVPGAGGVSGVEMVTLRANPSSNMSNANYEDIDWSTFGAPNVFNLYQPGNPTVQDDSKLGGVQDFSALRNPVLGNTYDWAAGGTASFGTAGNWQNADTGVAAGTAPQTIWTARLANSAGGAKIAQVSANTSVMFATVMADGGSMTLEVQNGAMLSAVGGDEPGRVLVMEGGTLKIAGGVTANTVEAFSGGTISGGGTITGNLANSGGAVAPGASAGTLTVTGNYVQTAGAAAAAVAGDFNNDTVVDAADYTVWRNNFGDSDETDLHHNGDGGDVGTSDYDYWKLHYGDSASVSGLLIELGGTGAGQFDKLAVTGSATLAGTLDISLINGFSPTFNNMFTILTASSVSGSLALTGDQAENFDLIVNPTSVVLHYLLVPEGGGGGATVPEPASGVLAAMALAAVAMWRRQR